MKEFVKDLKTLIEVYISNPILFWMGLFLLLVFSIIGMIASIKLWLPVALVVIIVVCIIATCKESLNMLNPEREVFLKKAISYIIIISIRRNRFPYRIDIPSKEILAKRIKIIRRDGVEFAVVPLLPLDKIEEINLELLDKALSDHIEEVIDSTPDLGIKAHSDFYNAVTLIDLQKVDMEIQIRMVIADNWLAVRFLDNWFQEELNRQKRGKHYE